MFFVCENSRFSRRSRRFTQTKPKTTLTTKPQNSLNLKQPVFLCVIMQLAAFLCVICAICGRIYIQTYSINIHKRNPSVSRRSRRLRRQTTKHQNPKTSNHNNHTNSLARAHSISIKQVSKCRISDIQSLNLDLSVLKVSVKCRSFIIHRHIITAGIATYHVVTLAVQYMTYTHDVTIVHGYIAILLLHLLHDLCCCKA